MAMASISFDGSSDKVGPRARIAATETSFVSWIAGCAAKRTEVENLSEDSKRVKGCDGAGGVLPLAPSLSAPFNRSLIGAGSACVRDAAVSGRRSQTIFG